MIWALRCQLSSFSLAEKENDKSGGKQKLEADIVVIRIRSVVFCYIGKKIFYWKRKAPLSTQDVYTWSSHKPKTQKTTKTPSTQPIQKAHNPSTHKTTKPQTLTSVSLAFPTPRWCSLHIIVNGAFRSPLLPMYPFPTNNMTFFLLLDLIWKNAAKIRSLKLIV